jgi:imidazole glycerol-phosphate synthase subunit HisH
MTQVAIIDYGMGNLVSVAGAVERLGHVPVITSDARKLDDADRLILPGVGAFGDAMDNLRRRGLVDALQAIVVEKAKPILGICLGAQLLAKDSEEFGHHEGLNWIDASVRRITPSDPKIRVPHVGWNDCDKRRDSVLMRDVPEDALFYYVHSYCIVPNRRDEVVAECDYGMRFAAVLERGNMFATQFHPEKSQRHGLTVLRNFIEAP